MAGLSSKQPSGDGNKQQSGDGGNQATVPAIPPIPPASYASIAKSAPASPAPATPAVARSEPATPITARKKVRFSMDMLPNAEAEPIDTELARAYIEAQSTGVQSIEAATTETATLDNQEGEPSEEADGIDVIAQFRAQAAKVLPYNLSIEEVYVHVEAEVDRLSEKMDQDEFKFYSLTKDRALVKLQGRLAYPQFKKAFQDNGGAIFQEFRSRSLIVSALRDTNVELYNIAKRLSQDANHMSEWGEAIAVQSEERDAQNAEEIGLLAQQLEEAQQNLADLQANQGSASLGEMRDANARLVQRQREIDRLTVVTQDQDSEITRLKGLVADMLLDRQQKAGNGAAKKTHVPSQGVAPERAPVPNQNVASGNDPDDDSSSSSSDEEDGGNHNNRNPNLGGRGSRHTTPGEWASEISAGGTKHRVKRSVKFPDPPVWHNDPAEDKEVNFSNWWRKLNNKLINNADHFPTDRHRMGAIEGFLGGKAYTEVSPYLEEGHPNQITTSDELLQWLKDEYDDPNQRVIAKGE